MWHFVPLLESRSMTGPVSVPIPTHECRSRVLLWAPRLQWPSLPVWTPCPWGHPHYCAIPLFLGLVPTLYVPKLFQKLLVLRYMSLVMSQAFFHECFLLLLIIWSFLHWVICEVFLFSIIFRNTSFFLIFVAKIFSQDADIVPICPLIS